MAKITVGLEFEAAELVSNIDAVCAQHGYHKHMDGTIASVDGAVLRNPGEVITPPFEAILGVTSSEIGAPRVPSVTFSDVEAIKAKIRTLSLCATKVNKTCGLHVHVGCPQGRGNKSHWTDEQIRTWLLVGLALEDRLYDVVPASRGNNRFCKKIKEIYSEEELASWNPLGEISPRKWENTKRYCWLNLIETRRNGSGPRYNSSGTPLGSGEATGTVEIRLLGNVKRSEYIFVWTKFWAKIAGMIAYLPSSLAIASAYHRVQADIDDIKRVKNNVYVSSEEVERLRREQEAQAAVRPAAEDVQAAIAEQAAAEASATEAAIPEEALEPVVPDVAFSVAPATLSVAPAVGRRRRTPRTGGN
jgi:hypothetical protein